MISYGANIPITIYNIGSLLAAICYSFTMMRFASISLAGKTPKRRLFISFVALFITLLIIGVLVLFRCAAGISTIFYSRNRFNPYPASRPGSDDSLMGSTAIYVYRDYKETRTVSTIGFLLVFFASLWIYRRL